jgi:glycosyltransferase involved in cell wall biosynthesis
LFPALHENSCPLHLPVFIHEHPGIHRQLRQSGIPATAWDGVRPSAVSDDCFPDAAFLYENLIFLPIHQSLTDRDLDMTSDALSKVSRKQTVAPGKPNQSTADEPAGNRSARPLSEKEDPRKKMLLVAYHFPPQMGSSGLLRSLKYCRYLPQHGWQPTVLTTHPRAYERLDSGQLAEIPASVKVIRAFALDTSKHLSFRGRYLRFSALPDRWVTWCLGAAIAGIVQIRRDKTDVIFTTFPIATAVLIGYLLHRMTGVPWVADFRDSMTEDEYPAEPRMRRAFRWLEKKAVQHAARLIFTAHSTRQMYLQRYPELSPEKCLVVSNGYDEEDFSRLAARDNSQDMPLRICHSGLIYPEERNPVPFFQALSRLKSEKLIDAAHLSVDLRACGHEATFREIVTRLQIEDLVHFLPALPYHEALEDCNAADVSLLMQAACCDHQIPAKAYEYLRLGKPILALTSRTGDTAALLQECGGATLVDIADEDEIYRVLPDFLRGVRSRQHCLPNQQVVSKYSRQNQAGQLALCLSSLMESRTQQSCDRIKATSNDTVRKPA